MAVMGRSKGDVEESYAADILCTGLFPIGQVSSLCLNSDSPQFMRSLQILTLLLLASESVLCAFLTHFFSHLVVFEEPFCRLLFHFPTQWQTNPLHRA